MKKLILAIIIIMSVPCVSLLSDENSNESHQIEIKETQLAKLKSGFNKHSFTASPDGRRFAYIMSMDDGQIAVIDGYEDRKFEIIADDAFTFSPDSTRVAYKADRNNKTIVVVDGEESRGYEYVGKIVFSSDSQRIAYVAENDGKSFVVVGGVEGKRYDYIITTPVFSPDGKRIAYWAINGSKWVIIIDGKEERKSDPLMKDVRNEIYKILVDQLLPPVFSNDGSKIAYAVKNGDKDFVVINGKEYDGMSPIIFSPDGQHLVHLSAQDNKAVVVLDGVKGNIQYELIASKNQ